MTQYQVILDDGHETIGTFVEYVELNDSGLRAEDDDDNKSDILESDILESAIREKAIAQFRHKFGNSQARKMVVNQFYELKEVHE